MKRATRVVRPAARPFGWQTIFTGNEPTSMVWHGPPEGPPRPSHPAACHIHQQDWGVPVQLVPGAESRLTLMLHGVAPA